MEMIVANIEVVNDTAEGAGKDVSDFASSANDGGQRGEIVEVQQ
jgi:hypothetical protein